MEQNKADVRAVLPVKENGLSVKLEKCPFFQSEIEFLGFKLTSSGITLQESSVSKVTNWPAPKNGADDVFGGFQLFLQVYQRLQKTRPQ